ncbi:MAG: hypothetical protein B6D61_03515 [Bacteroidetes bacterium 4484_249]|nr:MAG: hypothetical protein B6D61_03515 [Bacteroidetes bacterium 4484_249]
MTTYIEDLVDIKDNLLHSTRLVLNCESEIENYTHNQFKRNAHYKLAKSNAGNYQFSNFDPNQSLNPFLFALYFDTNVSSLEIIEDITDEDLYIKPKPIKSYNLSAKIISKRKGIPKIYPID